MSDNRISEEQMNFLRKAVFRAHLVMKLRGIETTLMATVRYVFEHLRELTPRGENCCDWDIIFAVRPKEEVFAHIAFAIGQLTPIEPAGFGFQ